MIKLLKKELLYDMGITAVGDVLAILNHCNARDSQSTDSESDKVCTLCITLRYQSFSDSVLLNRWKTEQFVPMSSNTFVFSEGYGMYRMYIGYCFKYSTTQQ